MENNMNDAVNSLLSGLNGFVSSKTVIGEPVVINDITIIPLTDVQFGVGAGAFGSKSSSSAGGMGAKLTPTAILLVQKDGATKLLNVRGDEMWVKLVDRVPDVVDRLKGIFVHDDPEVDAKVDEIIHGGEA